MWEPTKLYLGWPGRIRQSLNRETISLDETDNLNELHK